MKKFLKHFKKHYKRFFTEIFFLFVLIGLMSAFWKQNTLLTIIFISIFVLIIPFLKKSDIIFFIFVTLFFQVEEILMALSGAWTYNNPSYIGIPIWISLSWGFCALIIKRLGKTFDNIINS